jgi:thiamine biosynthesis lipoprotein
MYRIPPPLSHLLLLVYRPRLRTPFIWLLLLAGIALAVSACSRGSDKEHKHTTLAFGTLIEITLFDTTEAKANAAFDQLERNFHAYHASWTPWATSDLSRINDAIRAGTEVVVPDSILPMLTASMALFEQSHGLFNPAIGNLINLWQMHLHEDPDIHPPDAQDIARMLQQNPRMSDIQIDGNVLQSSNRNVQLSLGAFAKGYAIDLSLDYLRSQGIENAVINAGGDLRVAGRRGERAWRIGIRHPRADGVIAWLDATGGESIFTSGDYERFYHYDGKRYHHILDPRTGYPAAGTSSVTVIHDNAGTADAAATALFVAGPEHWHEIARAMGIRFVMLIDTEGRIHMNPAMQERINLVNPESGHIVLSQPL